MRPITATDRHITRFGTTITGLHWAIALADHRAKIKRRAHFGAYLRGEVTTPEPEITAAFPPDPRQMSLGF